MTNEIDPFAALVAKVGEWRTEEARMRKWLDFNDAHNNIQPEDAANILKQCADELEALIGGLREKGWQPIATAPKDGTRLLLTAPREPGESWVTDVGCFTEFPMLRTVSGPVLWNWGWTYQPTHWQPLPAPPDGSSPGGSKSE